MSARVGKIYVDGKPSDPGCVYIGRPGKGITAPEAIWHNPFWLGDNKGSPIANFCKYIAKQRHLLERLDDLNDKTLLCFCRPASLSHGPSPMCHGEILALLVEHQAELHFADYDSAETLDMLRGWCKARWPMWMRKPGQMPQQATVTAESTLMDDVLVTVPLSFGLEDWIDEGDAAGEPESGEDWHFYLPPGPKPNVAPGARVYVTYNGILRGHAPLVRVEYVPERGTWALVRRGGAVAVTIDEPVPGFRGFKARWWKREDERPFDYPWHDGRPAWTVPMEWSRQEWSPQLDWREIHPRAQHMGAMFVDDYPIAGYWKEGGAWHCSKCGLTFPAAKDVQAHIKASQDHIQRGVAFYMDWLAKRKEQEGVPSR